MNIDALVGELRSRYSFLEDEKVRTRLGCIEESDVELWTARYGGDRRLLYDALARYLAVAFHQGKLPFAFCDAVMNDLHTVITMADDVRPELFWRVFLAFDAGEYHRSSDRSDDPIAAYTEPAIAEIVSRL